MSASDFLENKSLDHTLGVAEYVYSAGGRYLALFTSDPTDANITANEVDAVVDDTAYARQSVAFDAAVAGESASNTTQTFPAVVYGSNGVAYPVTHVGIYDAITGGNLQYHGALAATINRLATKTLVFEAGTLKVTLS